MIEASVVILTLNSSKTLNRCLQSINSFNDIIAIDGGSLDNTLNILRKYNCRIYKQNKIYKYTDKKIKNFSKVRFDALKLAKNNLVLFLDSDEFVSKNFCQKLNIISKLKYLRKKISYYLIRRDVIFENCKITNTAFWPNWHPRLVYKDNINRYVKHVHERPVVVSNEQLLVKKCIDEAIRFDFPNSVNKINLKHKYYYKIEKTFMVNSINYRSLYFIFYRLLVLTKFFLVSINNLFFYKKKKFSRLETLMILIYFKFTLKLFLSLFKLKKN